jgi:hypothetical protein
MTRQPPSTYDSGTPSARREPMSGPSEARELDDRLHDIDPATRGEFVSDHQRDRDSNGVAGGYDDSIERRKGDEDTDRLGVARGD